jgi:hypothetical protein
MVVDLLKINTPSEAVKLTPCHIDFHVLGSENQTLEYPNLTGFV